MTATPSPRTNGKLRLAAVIEYLRRRYGHVSAKRVLSGGGLEDRHDAIATLDEMMPPTRRAAEADGIG